MDIIKNAIANENNVVVAGNASVGITTDLDTGKTFPDSDRIISIEDVDEITDAELEKFSCRNSISIK